MYNFVKSSFAIVGLGFVAAVVYTVVTGKTEDGAPADTSTETPTPDSDN